MLDILRLGIEYSRGVFIPNRTNISDVSLEMQIPSRSSKESFSGNSVKISDCRAFSLFKTLPGCRGFRHSEKKTFKA